MTIYHFFKPYTIVFIIFLSSVPELGWAQEQEEQPEVTALSEVVITATKFEVPSRKTSRPVQVISQQEIVQSGAQDLAQVLQRQSGIMVNGAYSNPGLNKSVYLRGATGEFTTVLIDGMPINDPSGVAGVLDLRLLPLGQIDRIEIMKGSQSSLYGSGAISGVINIITKTGQDDKPIGAQGNLSVGSFNTTHGNLHVGGRAKKWNYNVGVQHLFTEGLSDAAPRAGVAAFEKDRFLQTGVNAHIGFKATEHIEISSYIRYMKNEGGYDGGSFIDVDSNRYTSDLLTTGGIATYKAERLNVRLGYGYTQIDRSFVSSRESTLKGRLHDLDGYASYQINDIINLSGGLNYQDQQMTEATGDITDPAASIFSNYWHAVVTPTQKLIIELSYRFNLHARYGSNSTYSIAPAYWITKRIKAFASYNTGYKAPTLSQLYGRFGANEELQPQTSASWEVGGGYYAPDGRIKTTLTYYNRAINNLIIYGVERYENRDVQQNNGVEASINWAINPQLNVTLVYDFTTGSVVEKRGNLGDTTYNNLIRRPEHSVKATVMYRPIPSLSLSLGGQYIGERKDIFFDETFVRRDVDLASYFLLNVYAEYEVIKDKMHVFADLKNATDTNFSELYGYTHLPLAAQFGLRFQL